MIKYSLLNRRKQLHVIRTMHCRTRNSYFPADKCYWLYWAAKLATKLSWSEPCGLFSLWHSSTADISGEDHGQWPSETVSEQLLRHDQSRTNQRCYWSEVQTTDVGHSFSWPTRVKSIFSGPIPDRKFMGAAILDPLHFCLEIVAGINVFKVRQ